MWWKLFVIVSVGFDVTGQLLIIYSALSTAFIKYLRKKMEYNEAVHQLFRNFRNAYDSVGGRSSIIFSLSMVSP
jgi:hypothetical protein